MRKVDGYMTCHVTHSETVFRLENMYRERFSAAPPAPDTEVVLPTLADPKPCLDAIATAKAMQPSLPVIDDAGEAYGAALATIHRLVTPYDRSQAARIHGELLAAFDAFDRAQPVLFDQLYEVNRTVHLAQFAKRKAKDGRTFSILVEEAQLRAEDLVRFAATPATELDKLDISALTTSLAQFERSMLDLEAFEVRKPDEAKALKQRIVEQAHELAVAARQLAHRATDKVEYSAAEQLMIGAGNEANVIGTPGALAFAYNKLVELR